MILGTLSLFQKLGVFYKEIHIRFEDMFSEIESKTLTEAFINPIHKENETFTITPVDESGSMDYITGTFEDDGKAQYPYEVTVWLLVEEPIMSI